MIYGSVCAGLEGASVAWGASGWRCAFAAEIEKFPRAVIRMRHPNVPLHGDFTTIKAGDYEPIDLLVGGTPCQSFSVAGLRKGLGDDRGNLALEFLRLADRLKPRFVVWENVPGVLSDSTEALKAMLDGFDELGYVVDIDILDAQFFGLAQRRRRVFICAERVDCILSARTPSSAFTLAQCLAECSLLTLAALSDRWNPASANLVFDATQPSLSLQKRMRLFGLNSSSERVSLLATILAAIPVSSECEPGDLASADGKAPSKTTEDTRSPDWTERAACLSTGPSWSAILADALEAMSASTTSISTSETIEPKIYSCAILTARIAERINRSTRSSPCFWSAATSALTALEAFIEHARQASSDLFTDPQWIHPWSDFERQAVPLHESLGRLGLESFGEVFPVRESVRGHPAPSRQAGKDPSRPITPGSESSGGYRNDADRADDLISEADGSGFPLSGMRRDERADMVADVRMVRPRADGVAHAVVLPIQGKGKGAAASMRSTKAGDGIGRDGDPMFTIGTDERHAVAFAMRGRDDGAVPEAHEAVSALRSASGGSTRDMIAFDTTQITHPENRSNPKPGDPSHQLTAKGHPPAVAFSVSAQPNGFSWESDVAPTVQAHKASDTSQRQTGIRTGAAVRRLTPMECERLQGFPDGYTDIAFRGKPAADAPRYKALGNAFAVNVVRWIGQRIEMVEEIERDRGRNES